MVNAFFKISSWAFCDSVCILGTTINWEQYAEIVASSNWIILPISIGDSEKLMNDLKTITNNGATINGKAITWTAAPHVYKKGRIIVIYDGSNETTLTDLKDILGDPILG